ncbi:MAG: DUF1289 domain-containing protein [Hyphomicrobiales bacterium]|nr:DUF1289 domain-containing protein [Hyphomicrobiales bacterium]
MSAPRPPSRAALSPCRQICVMDVDSGLCEGCGRTLKEIAEWAQLSDVQRMTIMMQLDDRLARRAAKGSAVPQRET